VAAAYAAGTALLRGACQDHGIRFVAGAAALSLVLFGLCAAGCAYPLVFAGLEAGVLLMGPLVRLRPGSHKSGEPAGTIEGPPSAVKHLFLLIFGIYLILYFFNSMAPEASFDGSRYHLGLVGRYLREHGFHRITDNMYAGLSQGVEMLYLFAYAFGRHSAAAMVHFAFLLALCWQMFGYSRRAGFPLAGACGALLVFASPMAGVDATSAYNDVAVAAIAFTLFHLLQVWDDTRSSRLLWP